MIINLADNQRTNAGSGIGGSKGLGDLERELFFADAVHEPSESHTILGSAKRETVAKARQFPGHIGREEVNIIAEGTQPKAHPETGRRIKVVLRENAQFA